MNSEMGVVEQAEAVLMQQVLSHQPSGNSRRGLDTHSTAPWLHHMASSPAHEANPMPRQNLTKAFQSRHSSFLKPLAPSWLILLHSNRNPRPCWVFTFRKGSDGLGLGARTWNCAWFSRELGSCGVLGLQLYSSSVDNR